ncbi:hypothetical protein MRB53_001440 [Persea americana]|uniref:Uncharacterized protein n=1 Tax=Persea americana TaxID=3435 RepID=A0ACC2MRL2_PERAE|nr:hypothetical protein MRB53_001440 [Persea americana]
MASSCLNYYRCGTQTPESTSSQPSIFKDIFASQKEILTGGTRTKWFKKDPHCSFVALPASRRTIGKINVFFPRGNYGRACNHHRRSTRFKDLSASLTRTKKGFITIRDLRPVMTLMRTNPTEAQLKHMINEVDADQKGTINFEDFVNTLQLRDEMTNLNNVFTYVEADGTIRNRKVVADGDGQLNYGELDESLRISDASVEDMFEGIIGAVSGHGGLQECSILCRCKGLLDGMV